MHSCTRFGVLGVGVGGAVGSGPGISPRAGRRRGGVVWCCAVWCVVVCQRRCYQMAMAKIVLYTGNASREGCVCKHALYVVCGAPVCGLMCCSCCDVLCCAALCNRMCCAVCCAIAALFFVLCSVLLCTVLYAVPCPLPHPHIVAEPQCAAPLSLTESVE